MGFLTCLQIIFLGANKIGVSVLVVTMVPTQLFFFLLSQTSKCSTSIPFFSPWCFPTSTP